MAMTIFKIFSWRGISLEVENQVLRLRLRIAIKLISDGIPDDIPPQMKILNTVQGFSLASAIGHSPKIVPDVREFAVQFGPFVRGDFRKCRLYGNAQ